MFVVLFSEISHPFAEHPEQGHDAPVRVSSLGDDMLEHVCVSRYDIGGAPGPSLREHPYQQAKIRAGRKGRGGPVIEQDRDRAGKLTFEPSKPGFNSADRHRASSPGRRAAY